MSTAPTILTAEQYRQLGMLAAAIENVAEDMDDPDDETTIEPDDLRRTADAIRVVLGIPVPEGHRARTARRLIASL
jgi:hypothetical protein